MLLGLCGQRCRQAFVWRASLVLMMLFASPSFVHALSLKVGVYDNPPKVFMDADGEPGGILGELLADIAEEESWQLESVACQWQQCLEWLKSGDIDLLPDVAWSAERAQYMHFHEEPALHSWSQIYQREGVGLDAILDLDGSTVAVINGSIQQRYLMELTERFAIEVDWLGVKSFADGFQAVASDKADAAVANHLFGGWHAAELGLQETPIIFQPVRLYYAASFLAPGEVLSRIDDHLREWKAKAGSSYYTILRNWRSDPSDVPRVPSWLLWSLGVLLLMLLAALLGYWFQRKRSEHSAAQLIAHRAMLETILDNLEAHVYIKSPTLEYRYVNRKICALLEQPPENVLGRRDEAFFDTATTAEWNEVDRRVLASGKKVTTEESLSLKNDPTVRTFLSIKMPLVMAPGEEPSLCGISTDLTDYQEMQSRTHFLAFYDALTGLPNRRLLFESLASVVAGKTMDDRFSALLVVNLDSFRLVNDIQGHDCGDQLLVRVAECLQSCLDAFFSTTPKTVIGESENVNNVAMLSRFSSDEFVVLIDNVQGDLQTAAHHIERLARQLIEAINQLSVRATLPIGASVGITLFHDVIEQVDVVLQQADMALQQAKVAGGNTLRFFNTDMQTSVLERASLEADLHQALERDELVLFYQRQVDDQGVTTGVEALLRWQHPERGQVSPGVFIPLAEETGLIVPIGRWVLETAARQLAFWSRDTAYSTLTISVNVSSVQFQHSEFVGDVEQILHKTQAPPGRLMLEVTESLLMHDPSRVRHTMLQLRDHGVRFALDDFGTGYSSLSYLKRLPLDELKIDQSFIRELLADKADAAIVETTILLANSLGLSVVAEGVETSEQLAWLRAHGCMRYQGYLLGRPAPIAVLFEGDSPQHNV
ncbi:EAL domain-containing protein [Vreelandella aquamarina]